MTTSIDREHLDPAYEEAAIRAGRMMLFWAGLETDDGTHLNDEAFADHVLEAIGNSSVPEGCCVVADSCRESYR